MTNDSPIARRVEREVMADRVAAHLGLDPMEVVAESLTLSPVAGDKVLVRWEGIKLVSSEEAARALGVAPDRENRSEGDS
ncbi:MAG TPA: hypothetical protein VLZ78_05275 [Terrimesophilobacter sp.]|nr:hypothetical protein [Terrimesophilobacter sp.]